MGELYAYLPFHDENTVQLMKVPPKSIQNLDYGFSVGRGSFRFNSGGEGDIITERIKLNEIGASNGIIDRLSLNVTNVDLGEIEIRMNGETVILASGLTIRTSSESFARGLHFQTFFGGMCCFLTVRVPFLTDVGHGKEWASPKDQYAWFSDVSGAIIART